MVLKKDTRRGPPSKIIIKKKIQIFIFCQNYF